MRSAEGKIAVVVCGLLFAAAVTGCGGKSKDDNYEPPAPAVAQNTPPADPPKPEPKSEPKPADPPKNEDPPKEKEKEKGPAVPPPFTVPPPPPPEIPQPAPMPKPLPKDPPPAIGQPMPKEPPKDPNKPFEWPTSIYGRPLSEYIKDIDDPDPAVREQGLRTAPAFGPDARKPSIKSVLRRMNAVYERDPGVRAAAFEAIGAFALFSPDGIVESEADTAEALRILIAALAPTSPSGGAVRLHAVNTLANFGPRAHGAIDALVGQNMTSLEPAYETRRSVATTLGAISFIKDVGPSPRAMNALTDILVADPSAAVRLAAYQSIVLLGPVYLPPTKDASGKPVMKVDEKTVANHVKAIKARLHPFKAQPGSKIQSSHTGLMETDRQVEIFARLALMRLDVKEQTDENLTGIAKYITQPGDSGPKLQALQAMQFMGIGAARRINDVCKALEDEDPQVVVAAASALVAMGTEGKPAIEFLEKMKTRGTTKEEKEQFSQLADRAIKAIKEAKPFVPKP
ncbi:MAG: HEAT repeat domain-containing protein [Gemmataceae bacterium]